VEARERQLHLRLHPGCPRHPDGPGPAYGALTIDHGWREVADTALSFIQKQAQH